MHQLKHQCWPSLHSWEEQLRQLAWRQPQPNRSASSCAARRALQHSLNWEAAALPQREAPPLLVSRRSTPQAVQCVHPAPAQMPGHLQQHQQLHVQE